MGRVAMPPSCSGSNPEQVDLLLHTRHTWEPQFPPSIPGSSHGPCHQATLPQQQQPGAPGEIATPCQAHARPSIFNLDVLRGL